MGCIHNNGGGIPPAARDKVFMPFFTTKPTGQETGPGLSISWDILVHKPKVRSSSTARRASLGVQDAPSQCMKGVIATGYSLTGITAGYWRRNDNRSPHNNRPRLTSLCAFRKLLLSCTGIRWHLNRFQIHKPDSYHELRGVALHPISLARAG